MADYTDFLDAPDDARHDGFLNAPDTRTETKGHSFKQYNPSESFLGKLFGKYAPDVIDWAAGATGTMRGAMNLVSPGSGSKTFPTSGPGLPFEANPESGAYLAGSITDPAAAALGYGAGKLVQAVPMVTKAYRSAEAVRAANAARTAGTAAQNVPLTVEQIARSAVAGGGAGAGAGYLASEGDLENTAKGGLFGAGVGGVLPVAGKGIQLGLGKSTDMLFGRGGQVKAGQIARAAAGENLPQIRTAMENAPADLSAGQAAFGINQDPWQALGRLGETRDTASFYRQLMERQAQQRVGMLSGVTPDLAAAEANRTTQFGTDIAAARDAASRARLVREASVMPPKPAVTLTPSNLQPGMTTNVVTPGPIPSNFPGIPAIEALKANPVINAVVADARRMAAGRQNLPQQFGDLTDAQITDILKDPTKSLEGLQLMKAAIDARFSKNPSTESALAKFDDATITKVKKAFTGAVDMSIPEYGQARANFATNSEPINQAKVLEGLRQKLVNPLDSGKDRAGVFTAALDRGEQSVLRQSGLNTRFNDSIEAALTPQQFQTVSDISSALTNQQALNQQAKAGAGGLETIMQDQAGKFRLPNLFNQKVALANKFLEVAEKYLTGDSIKAISKGMQSGKTALEMLDTLPAAERNRAFMWIGQAGRMAPTAAGTTGELVSNKP